MNYIDFYSHWRKFGCFSIRQIYVWKPDFNRLNLNYWIKKGLVLKLRNGWYAFSECTGVPDFGEYVANRIYRPSYISLQYAMAHYGMIPEAVMDYTSVTSLKTTRFSNALGDFFYYTVKSELMFGYKPITMPDGRAILFATPEKALLDFIYLNPSYKTEEDFLELRLDEDFMSGEFNYNQFREYSAHIKLPAFSQKIELLINTCMQ